MKADPNPHHLKTSCPICDNYLALCSQKTDTVPALLLMRKIVMQRSPLYHSGRHHHKQLLWFCRQQDQSQHLPQQIALHRVMQTRWHYKETMGITKTIQPCQFNILTTTSFQMEVIGASMTYRTRHFTEAYWKMDIMHILWNFQTSNHYFAPADT